MLTGISTVYLCPFLMHFGATSEALHDLKLKIILICLILGFEVVPTSTV